LAAACAPVIYAASGSAEWADVGFINDGGTTIRNA